MDNTNIFAALIAPALTVLIIFYLKIKVREVSITSLAGAFLWGLATILPVFLSTWLARYFELDDLRSLRRIIFYSLVVTAFFSEFGKFLVLRIAYYPRNQFRTPVDGILYSILISMGYATAGSILLYSGITEISLTRLSIFTMAPAHLVFGVVLGFFLGLGKLRKMRFIDSMTGMLAALFFHALYTFCLLTSDDKLLLAFFAGSALIVFTLAVAAVRISIDAQMNEKHR